MRSTAAFRSLFLLAMAATIASCEGTRERAVVDAGPDDAVADTPVGDATDAGDAGAQQPTSVLASTATQGFATWGGVTASTVPVTGQSFASAWNLVGGAGPYSDSWRTQMSAPVVTPIEKGDVLLATFWARCDSSLQESAECKAEFVFERASDPWTKSVNYPVSAGKDWMQFFVRFTAAESYTPPTGAHVVFNLGFANQTLQVGGISVVNYFKTVTLDELPTTSIHYGGEAADAPWRKEADDRIEAIRKGDLTITVQDSNGQPISGATVAVKMKRHAFSFGTAMSSFFMHYGATDNVARYKQELVKLFNTVVEENALKWPPLAGDWGANWGMDLAQEGVDWAVSQGLAVRGHNLVWPSWRNSPAELKNIAANADAGVKMDAGDDAGATGAEVVRTVVRNHITDTAGALAGKLIHWDVVNEPFDNHDITDLPGFGISEMVEWFKLAREADPLAKLFINDYAILAGGGGTTAHRDFYEKTIKDLLAGGAPLDGFGMQGHFGLALTSLADAKDILDRFAKLGPEIWITEYDIAIDDLDLAGRYTRDLLTMLFSHPKVGGFMMWGFWDGAHFANNAPLYTNTWSLKPAGQAYKDLVFGKWWTNTSCTSGVSGSCLVRGFLGDYELTVTAGGDTKTVTAKLPTTSGASITVTM